MKANKTPKQKIIDMLNRLPDDLDYERAIEGIYILQRHEIGLDEIRRGKVSEDDDVMAELLSDGQETPAGLERSR